MKKLKINMKNKKLFLMAKVWKYVHHLKNFFLYFLCFIHLCALWWICNEGNQVQVNFDLNEWFLPFLSSVFEKIEEKLRVWWSCFSCMWEKVIQSAMKTEKSFGKFYLTGFVLKWLHCGAEFSLGFWRKAKFCNLLHFLLYLSKFIHRFPFHWANAKRKNLTKLTLTLTIIYSHWSII